MQENWIMIIAVIMFFVAVFTGWWIGGGM